jgi:hypothetical protein
MFIPCYNPRKFRVFENWLVVQALWKILVNGKDDILYIMDKNKCSKPPTRLRWIKHLLAVRIWHLSPPKIQT